ncbi:MAG: hypothetical protein JJU36_14525 [Phycisphaeraceae bacterium]|nr:hypothetical protein [Phycisphaeraceae bacterium]
MNQPSIVPEPALATVGGVFRRTGMFMFAAAFSRASGLLILPILIMIMSPAEFTRFGLMISVFVIAPAICSLNVHLSPVRLYFDQHDDRHRARLLTTTLVAALAMTGAAVVLVVVVLGVVGVDDPISMGSFLILMVMGAVVMGRVVVDYAATLMRITGAAGAFVVLSLVQGLGLILCVLVMPFVITDRVLMIAAAYALTMAACATLGLIHAVPLLRNGSWDRAMLSRALAFAWPMSISFITAWLQQQSGRWIGAAVMPLEDLASYTLVLQLVLATGMLTRAAGDARVPDIGSAFAQRRIAEGLAVTRNVLKVSLGTVLVVYMTAAVAMILLAGVIPEGFRPSLGLLGLGLVINLADAANMTSVYRLVALKRTGIQAMMLVIGAMLSVGGMIVLVPILADAGLMLGAALGLCVQGLILRLVTDRCLKRIEPPPDGPSDIKV